MLTFILIAGLAWLFVALVFVLALAAAARKQVSPVAVNSSVESREQEISTIQTAQTAQAAPVSASRSAQVEEPVSI